MISAIHGTRPYATVSTAIPPTAKETATDSSKTDVKDIKLDDKPIKKEVDSTLIIKKQKASEDRAKILADRKKALEDKKKKILEDREAAKKAKEEKLKEGKKD